MKAYELLSSPDKWCQGDFAKDAEGNSTKADSPAAARWCVVGALERCYDEYSFVALMNSPQIAAVLEVTGGSTLSSWNDHTDRKWQEVYDALKKADV